MYLNFRSLFALALKFILFLCSILTSIAGLAQQPLFTNQQHFGVEDGLPQSFISGITQDEDGFIWLGTLDGLARYDGREFKSYHYRTGDTSGLSSNAIAYLFPQENNRISLLYEGYDNDEFDMRYFTVKRNSVPDVLRKINGIVWNVTSTYNTYNAKDWVFVKKGYKGIGWYNLSTSKIQYANKANGLLQTDSIAALLQTSSGKLYLVSENGVHISDDAKKSFSFIPFYTGIWSRGANNQPVDYYGGRWVTYLPGNKLAITDYNRVVLLDLDKKSVSSIDLRDVSRPWLNEIPRLSRTDKNQQLYFEHAGRVFRVEKNGQVKLLWQNSIAPDLKITACFIDRSEVLWVSVNAQGLLKVDLRAMPFHSFQYKHNFFADILTQAGLSQSSFPASWLPEKEAYFFRYAYDAKGNLYCCYNPDRKSGLFRSFQNRLIEMKKIKGTHPVFKGVAIDNADGIWAYDMDKEGWYYWKDAEAAPEFFPLDEHGITGIDLGDVVFIGGHLWLSTYSQGLLQFDKGRLIKQFEGKTPFGIMPKELTEICRDPNDKKKIWIGSRGGGLILWDTEKGLQRIFTTNDGLPNNTVYCIVPDKNGNLWCSSNKGIFRFNPATHQVFGFEKPDGLPGNEFNRAHKFKFSNGRIAFGGLDGYTIFNPADFDLKKNVESVPVQITAIQINNEPQGFRNKESFIRTPLSQLENLDLPYNKNYLRFEFAAMQFNQPQKIRYRYQLEGADHKWIESGTNNVAAYSGLQPGNYKLLVNATDNNGQWSSFVKELTIHVRQPLWATWWAYVIYGLLVLAAIRWYIMFKDNRNRMQQKLNFEHNDALRLREMDEVKDRFFSNVTHEFRTPLTLIITPLERLLKENAFPEKVTITLQTIQKNSQRLLQLINEFLDFSKLNDGQMMVKNSTGQLSLFVLDCVESFRAAAKEKNILLNVQVKDVEGLYLFDEDKWQKIIGNLLSNAIKFTQVNGQVDVTLSLINEKVYFEVKDNGVGISSDEQGKVFDRFYQVDGSSVRVQQGTGIGLALVKELAEIMKGKVSVTSEPGKFTCFLVEVPVMRSGEQITDHHYEPVALLQGAALKEKEVSGALLLIADDNEELRSFLVKSLDQTYRIAEASNGTDAWNKILEELPDIVISDVMMPGRDGFDLCRLCKTDNRTAHIGFILLTSRAAHSAKLKGLETGADDFITKPFQFDELELRIANLLYTQEKIRSDLKRHLLDSQPKADLPTVENPFLKQLFAEMDASLDNPELGVDLLCHSMSMSKSTLNRKLKSMLNVSANELIRRYRLQKSATLLSDGMDIASVCYRVGFSSPSYFTQCFKDQYGITPTQYISSKE